MAPVQLERRATGFFEGLHGAAGIAFISTIWAGVTVAVCTTTGGGICVGSFVMTAVLSSAATIGFGLEITGSTAVNTKRAVLAGLAFTTLVLLLWTFWSGMTLPIGTCLKLV